MKCEICGRRIEVSLLNKIRGTFIKDSNGKFHVVCNECQSKFKTKKELLEQINR